MRIIFKENCTIGTKNAYNKMERINQENQGVLIMMGKWFS